MLEVLGKEVRRVLIVDDDRRVVALLARMVQSAERPYEVLRAYSGEDGMARLSREPVDVVLLDLVMPKIGGLDMIDRIRHSPRLAKLPVIVVTSKGWMWARTEHIGALCGCFVSLGPIG